MKIALCIEGGGAKGAYEAGVIKALYDNGIKEYAAVAGTSIGAINGYFVTTGNIEKLAYIWNNLDENMGGSGIEIVDNTVNNDVIIKAMYTLEEGSRKDIPLYVNYVEVNNKCVEEKVVETSKESKEKCLEYVKYRYTLEEGSRKDIPLYVNYVEVNNKCVEEKVVETSKESKEKCLEYVKYSSLLPFNPTKQKGFKEGFIEDVADGVHDGKCLDGGMSRGLIIDPVLEVNPDKIVVISTKDDYEISDELAEEFGKDNFVIARPKKKFDPRATLNLNGDFCRKIFAEGYEIGQELAKEFK